MYNQNITGGFVTGGTCPFCGTCPYCGMGGNYPLYPNGIGGVSCETTPQIQRCDGIPNACNQSAGLGSDTAQGGTLSGTPNITT
jgi:hypothetical protein